MKFSKVPAAVFGMLALVSANANATSTTDSSSFRVSLTIAAPCDVSTDAKTHGRGSVAVSCKSASTPYRLELDEARNVEPQAHVERPGERQGYARATLTF